ncbi:MAG: Gfo/Idh/MocA family oxidoreductase [Chitinophagaceae bacterium]
MIRREFIRHSGLLAGGILLQPELLRAQQGAPVNVAIIGCGDRGNGIAHVMKELPGQFSIKAICDVLDFRIEAAKKNIPSEVKVHKNYRALLDDKNIHAVIIATPLNLHYEMAIAALDAGKHVFLEKAMTYNIPQALKLADKVKVHPSQVLQVGHQYRYTPLYFKVKEMIEKGYLGKVTQIDCRWDRNWNWRRPVPDPKLERQINWRMYKEYSGGLVAELLSHQIDFIHWAFGTHPDTIMGTGGIDYYKDGRETFDNVQVILRYKKDGMIGNFGATCGNAHDGYLFKIKGTKGSVHLLVNDGIFYPEPATKKELETVDGVAGATKLTWNKDGGLPVTQEPMKDGTWYALKDFYTCIREKKKPASNVITGAHTAITVHLANNALYTRSMQQWKPAYNLSL